MSSQVSTRHPEAQTDRCTRVVVGVDDAQQRTGAILWACHEAARLHVPLQLVSACPILTGPGLAQPRALVGTGTEQTMRQSLSALAARLHGEVDMLPVQVAIGSPRDVLLDALDESTTMLVVGSRGVGAAHRVLLGSTSIGVAGRASVPVVVVPDGWVPAGHISAPVVVGTTLGEDVDAETDHAVLRFAFDRARELRVPVIVVHAWEVPTLCSWSPSDVADLRDRDSVRLEQHIESWRTEYPDVEVVARSILARSDAAVLDVARIGQVIVVAGHTSGSGHHGLRLGSTTRGVLHHSPTPVVVIPASPVLPTEQLHRSRGTAQNAYAPTF